MPRMEIYREFKFDAAHWLPRVPPGHKCARMHGHTYTVQVHVAGELDPALGWVLDFNDLRRLVEPLVDRLDHRVLNEVPGLENPTSEHLALWLWNQLKPALPTLSRVVVKENPANVCSYAGG